MNAPKVRRIICGFQDGADVAGARAGKRCGAEIGGYMPEGFLAKSGRHPEYAAMYGAQEIVGGGYRMRTRRNVAESDGTVRFAYDWKSRGEQCTFRAIRDFHKPYFDVYLARPGIRTGSWDGRTFIVVGQEPTDDDDVPMAEQFCRWLTAPSPFRLDQPRRPIEVLNVAGNGDPLIEGVVEEFLVAALRAAE